MEPRFDDALSRAFYEPPGGQYSRSLQRYRDPMRRFYPSSVQMDGAGGSRRDGLADVSWLRAELRRLRSENAALQQEVKWQGQCILKSERKSRVLVSELGTLKRYAEKTELMNPQLCLVLVGLICDLLRSIGKQTTAQVYQIVPECLALIDQCPFMDARLTDVGKKLRWILTDPQLPLHAAMRQKNEDETLKDAFIPTGKSSMKLTAKPSDTAAAFPPSEPTDVLSSTWPHLPFDLQWILVASQDPLWLAYKTLYINAPLDLRYIAVLTGDPRWLHNASTWGFTPMPQRLLGIARGDPAVARPPMEQVQFKAFLDRVERGIQSPLAPRLPQPQCGCCPLHCPLKGDMEIEPRKGIPREVRLRFQIKDIITGPDDVSKISNKAFPKAAYSSVETEPFLATEVTVKEATVKKPTEPLFEDAGPASKEGKADTLEKKTSISKTLSKPPAATSAPKPSIEGPLKVVQIQDKKKPAMPSVITSEPLKEPDEDEQPKKVAVSKKLGLPQPTKKLVVPPKETLQKTEEQKDPDLFEKHPVVKKGISTTLQKPTITTKPTPTASILIKKEGPDAKDDDAVAKPALPKPKLAKPLKPAPGPPKPPTVASPTKPSLAAPKPPTITPKPPQQVEKTSLSIQLPPKSSEVSPSLKAVSKSPLAPVKSSEEKASAETPLSAPSETAKHSLPLVPKPPTISTKKAAEPPSSQLESEAKEIKKPTPTISLTKKKPPAPSPGAKGKLPSLSGLPKTASFQASSSSSSFSLSSSSRTSTSSAPSLDTLTEDSASETEKEETSPKKNLPAPTSKPPPPPGMKLKAKPPSVAITKSTEENPEPLPQTPGDTPAKMPLKKPPPPLLKKALSKPPLPSTMG